MKALAFLVLFGCLFQSANSASSYFLGSVGQNCFDVCGEQQMNCNPRIVTGNSTDLFQQLGITCSTSPSSNSWSAQDQPSYVPTTPGAGDCLGFENLPSSIACAGNFPKTARLCRCDVPSGNPVISTACAGCDISPAEITYMNHFLVQGDSAVLTHQWTTYDNDKELGLIIRYYVDGETNASIQFTPAMMGGTGFNDDTTATPWGTQWFGKGANNGAWFNNFKVPFQRSLKVTIQNSLLDQVHSGPTDGIYVILRGATNIPVIVGGVTLPSNAVLQQFIVDATFQPLDFVNLANVTSGPGVFWMHTIAVSAPNIRFLEGCYRIFTEDEQEFPGILLSSGTEDYFDSGWYFDAGEFRLPVSGYTHWDTPDNNVEWSAYRFHDQDPLFFLNGFVFQWRNGDVLDASGFKCYAIEGTPVGNPGPANVTSYAWIYTWS